MYFFQKRFNMNEGVSSKFLGNNLGAVFAVPKICKSLLSKSMLLKILNWKERKVVSVVTNIGNR